jgi:hypothetical protein
MALKDSTMTNGAIQMVKMMIEVAYCTMKDI